jgi:Glycosyl hydrolase family 99
MRVRRSSIFIAAILAAGFILNGCSTNAGHRSIRDSLPATANAPEAYPKVLAVYEPWFGDKDHINVGYSTQDPNVLRSQIEKARNMGIYGFAVDWYGDRHPFLDRSTALLFRVASEMRFHVCLMYDETEEDNGHATDDALDAFDEAFKKYIGPNAPGRDAYVYYKERPVIFIFPKRGHTDWKRVRAVVNQWPHPPLLIYKDEPPQQYAADFDGMYAWVHPSKAWTPDGSDWGKDYLDNFYEKMKTKHTDKIPVGAAWPGFNDTRASWSLNRHMDQRCGKTFEDTLATYHRYYDQSNPLPFLLIATWNDYEEGTAIEPGLARCDKNPSDNTRAGGASQ